MPSLTVLGVPSCFDHLSVTIVVHEPLSVGHSDMTVSVAAEGVACTTWRTLKGKSLDTNVHPENLLLYTEGTQGSQRAGVREAFDSGDWEAVCTLVLRCECRKNISMLGWGGAQKHSLVRKHCAYWLLVCG